MRGATSVSSEMTVQEYLIFRLGQEEYGIEILNVQEIRGCDKVTRVPNAPQFLIGVTNLRGVIVPIVDLRVRFNLPVSIDGQDSVVIVLNLNARIIGIVVDGVADVLSLNSEQIKPTPDISAALSSRYLLGLGVIEQRMMILVNIEKLLSREELDELDAVTDALS